MQRLGETCVLKVDISVWNLESYVNSYRTMGNLPHANYKVGLVPTSGGLSQAADAPSAFHSDYHVSAF